MIEDISNAMKHASNLPVRLFLAVASTLYALTTALGAHSTPSAYLALAAVTDYRWSLVLMFTSNAFFLWWRILDGTPRRFWALFSNVFTFSLWTAITGATIFAYRAVLPDSVGEIMVTMASLYALMRTDFTWRDIRSA